MRVLRLPFLCFARTSSVLLAAGSPVDRNYHKTRRRRLGKLIINVTILFVPSADFPLLDRCFCVWKGTLLHFAPVRRGPLPADGKEVSFLFFQCSLLLESVEFCHSLNDVLHSLQYSVLKIKRLYIYVNLMSSELKYEQHFVISRVLIWAIRQTKLHIEHDGNR